MSCNISKVYKSVEACPGKKTLPGIRRRLYFIEKSAIATFPSLPEAGAQNVTEMSAFAQLSGDFVLASEKYWKFLDLKDEASNVTWEPAGDDSALYNNQANAILAGQDDDLKGFARQVIDDDLVYVYQDRGGKFCVLGNEMF